MTSPASEATPSTRSSAQLGRLDVFVSNAGVAPLRERHDAVRAPTSTSSRTSTTRATSSASGPWPRCWRAQHAARPARGSTSSRSTRSRAWRGRSANFAYAGSKFGGIGLTQSFALELIEYGIKVNAICPGNFLDGPLWSDPERGLFVQYLRAGKVPGATTVDDVRHFYEAKVPMGRGCVPADVARAVYYVIEQQYETGQAVPVTGGQNMLN